MSLKKLHPSPPTHTHRHIKCVQKLVEAGADISIHDNEGLTAVSTRGLHGACSPTFSSKFYSLLFLYFLQLHWVACNGRTALLVSILQRGEYVDVVVSERKKLLWLQHTTWLQIANMVLSTGCSWSHSPSCCLPEWPLSGMCWGKGDRVRGGGEGGGNG